MDFAGLSASNINYFAAVDVTNAVNPMQFLSGDCNFEIKGLPVTNGLLSLKTNDPVAWSPTRHRGSGYFDFVDGSVEGINSGGLPWHFMTTGHESNRLAIP